MNSESFEEFASKLNIREILKEISRYHGFFYQCKKTNMISNEKTCPHTDKCCETKIVFAKYDERFNNISSDNIKKMKKTYVKNNKLMLECRYLRQKFKF